MVRYVRLAWVLTLLLTCSILAADRPEIVTFTHYGHACFLITTPDQTEIMTDPVGIEGYSIPDSVQPDIVTVSHRHKDHDFVSGVSGQPVVFFGVDGPENQALKHELVPVDTQINDVHIYDLASNHFNPEKSPILNAIFVFDFNSIRVVHLGDLGYDLNEEQIAKIGPVDVLMIPVGGVYTLAPADADKVIALLKPRMLVLPMHYRTEAAKFLEFTAEDFLKGKNNVRRISGDSFTLDLSDRPQEVQYVILNTSEQ